MIEQIKFSKNGYCCININCDNIICSDVDCANPANHLYTAIEKGGFYGEWSRPVVIVYCSDHNVKDHGSWKMELKPITMDELIVLITMHE